MLSRIFCFCSFLLGLLFLNSSVVLAVSEPSAEPIAAIYADYLLFDEADSAEAVQKIKTGYKAATECVTLAPQNWQCHYYAGVFRIEMMARLYVTPQSAYHAIINDLEFVIANQPDFERAGAHRALGHFYLQWPILVEVTAPKVKPSKKNKKSKMPPVTKTLSPEQSLQEAWRQASKALRLFPKDPENLYLAGLVRLAQKDPNSAKIYFKQALSCLADYSGPKTQKKRLREAIQKNLKQIKSLY